VAEPHPNRAALLFGILFIVAGVAFLLERLGIWDFRLKYLAGAADRARRRGPSRRSRRFEGVSAVRD
jgi:hypothetical protein